MNQKIESQSTGSGFKNFWRPTNLNELSAS